MKQLTVAVDGPGSAGKGTVARGVARALGYRYLDTGAMYRAVALLAVRQGLSTDDAPALAALARALDFDCAWDGESLRVRVNGEDVTKAIRADDIGHGASLVSRHADVRAALTATQRALAREGGVVMDGRDIGTVVLPAADVKVFLDATLSERARRRHEELLRSGDPSTLADVRESLETRDRQDRERAAAPLRQADDAVYVDTSDLTIPQAIAAVLAVVRARGRP